MPKAYNSVLKILLIVMICYTTAGTVKAQSCTNMCKGLAPNQIFIKLNETKNWQPISKLANLLTHENNSIIFAYKVNDEQRKSKKNRNGTDGFLIIKTGVEPRISQASENEYSKGKVFLRREEMKRIEKKLTGKCDSNFRSSFGIKKIQNVPVKTYDNYHELGGNSKSDRKQTGYDKLENFHIHYVNRSGKCVRTDRRQWDGWFSGSSNLAQFSYNPDTVAYGQNSSVLLAGVIPSIGQAWANEVRMRVAELVGKNRVTELKHFKIDKNGNGCACGTVNLKKNGFVKFVDLEYRDPEGSRKEIAAGR